MSPEFARGRISDVARTELKVAERASIGCSGGSGPWAQHSWFACRCIKKGHKQHDVVRGVVFMECFCVRETNWHAVRDDIRMQIVLVVGLRLPRRLGAPGSDVRGDSG